ncbi:disease resistance protein RML1A-like [Bidens hawaiensis]|uniref:disease resistance protein RML1A-like n=1 Tax=Bidens hawaiensis TaxID=980011 RepID=UPI00404AA396
MENLVALDMSYSNIEYFDMSKDKRLLGLLKILDLSFCERLGNVGGFLKLPALERLIGRKCISLIEVCESVDQCVELVHIDLSYCYRLKKVPTSIGNLKKVETLLLDGCYSCVSEIGTTPRDLKLIAFSLSSSLRILSLANNNLSNESFPRDFSSLFMLKELYLDGNPIVSMPDCVRSLPRLGILGMNNCEMAISIEHPPHTLRKLSIYTHSLKKIKFDQEMSPLNLRFCRKALLPCSFEVDGVVKIQAMEDVEEKVLHSLRWTNLEFIKERRPTTRIFKGTQTECRTQMMFYELGIFSTFYWSDEMPNWIEYRSEGPSISFTIPSSPNKLRGLNFCCVETFQFHADEYVLLPMVKFSNITKKLTWFFMIILLAK